jgi:hypothetical protein
MYGWDPKVTSLDWLAQTLWRLGYPDQALIRIREAVAWAKELAHPASQMMAYDGAAWVHGFRGEIDLAREYVDALASLASEQGIANWAAIGAVHRSLVLAQLGASREDAVLQMNAGISTMRLMGAHEQLVAFLPWLAEAYLLLGDVEAGLGRAMRHDA